MILHLLLFFPRSLLLLWLSSSGATNKDAACSAEWSSPSAPSMPPSATNSCRCFPGGTEWQPEWGGWLRAGYDPSAQLGAPPRFPVRVSKCTKRLIQESRGLLIKASWADPRGLFGRKSHRSSDWSSELELSLKTGWQTYYGCVCLNAPQTRFTSNFSAASQLQRGALIMICRSAAAILWSDWSSAWTKPHNPIEKLSKMHSLRF